MLYYPTKCDMSVSHPVQGIFLAVAQPSHKETGLRIKSACELLIMDYPANTAILLAKSDRH